jgi:hypothetical protein
MMRTPGLAIAVMLATLCLQLPLPAQAAQRPLGKIASVSMLGTTFHAVHVGLTVFTNAAYTAEVPEWGIDQDTDDFLKATLAPGNDSVGQLDLGSQSVEQLYEVGRTSSPQYDSLVRMAAEQGFDTLVVVSRAAELNNRFIQPGFGLYVQYKFAYPYASFAVQVWNVKSGKRISGGFAYISEAFPDKSLGWKAQWTDFSGEERQRIQAGIEMHIHHELLRILRSHGLIPEEPRP